MERGTDGNAQDDGPACGRCREIHVVTEPEPRIPEKNKRPGVCYALTDDGVELPVIDVTNPAFAENPSSEKMASLCASFRYFQKLPVFIRRLASRNSIAMRGLNDRSATFLGGMTTYVAKLGPGVLGRGYSMSTDRRVAGAIGSVAFRIRLQDMARLMTDELVPVLSARPNRPVHMLNIGGGPAMDSLNSLILTRKERPELLAGRRIVIVVLDIDMRGPSFGVRALNALRGEGAPLHGLDVVLEHLLYDWTNPSALQDLLGRLGPDDVTIGSSEGGLFEYGSNEVILDNLRALRQNTPAEVAVVGSIMRDDDIPHWIQEASRFPLHLFKLADFTALVRSGGWDVRRFTELNPIQQVVSLSKSQ
jgi:hypothetical protein